MFYRSKGKDKHIAWCINTHSYSFQQCTVVFLETLFPASAHNLSMLGRYSTSLSLKTDPQFSQPEVVEEEAMNMVRLHLSQTLALSMRTKLKVNYMLSTVCLSGGTALDIFRAWMQESNLGCRTLRSTNYTLKISYDKETLLKLSRQLWYEINPRAGDIFFFQKKQTDKSCTLFCF